MYTQTRARSSRPPRPPRPPLTPRSSRPPRARTHKHTAEIEKEREWGGGERRIFKGKGKGWNKTKTPPYPLFSSLSIPLSLPPLHSALSPRLFPASSSPSPSPTFCVGLPLLLSLLSPLIFFPPPPPITRCLLSLSRTIYGVGRHLQLPPRREEVV